ncbi:MAG: porin family protein [Arachidicoccus sp.]|nr:porin family protein [Arachidicoccus sp.]
MTKKFLLLFSLALGVISISAQTQNISIGVRAGLTIPNLTGGSGTPLSEGYSTRAATGFGIFAEFKISKLFSIQPMLEYSQQGAKKSGMQAFPLTDEQKAEFAQILTTVPDYFYANFKSTAKINYLMLPILAKFGWDLGKNNHWRFYVDAGPYVGLLLNAHQVQTANGAQQIYYDKAGTQPVEVPYQPDPSDPTNIVQVPLPAQSFDTTVSIKQDLHKGNFGLEGNVGFAYKFKRNTVFIEGGGNYSLINIQKYAVYGKNHSGAGTVMIGYAISL